MSLVIKFYFTSMLNMFRTLIYPSSEACDFCVVSPHWLCVLVSMCVGVQLLPATRIPPQPSHTETPTHIETRTHNQCGDYLLIPWCRVLLEKLTGLQLVKKLPAFHGTRRFITALTSVRHLSLSWASPMW